MREADPFVASTLATDDPYRLVDYVRHSIQGGAELAAVLDRNLVSRVVSLAAGGEVDHSRPESEVDRIAAACMSFLITAEVVTEPNISLYELAESVEGADGQSDLIRFRIADHIHPQAYLEVALGRAHGIHPELIDETRRLMEAQVRPCIDLEMPLRHWRRHRCALTQITLLERSSLTGREKFEALLEWSVSPGFFDGVAIAFAIRLFGRAKPPGRLLKSARSNDPDKCLSGIRNAAWDLTYVSHWARQSAADERSRIWILCTNDRLLRDLAKISVGDEGQLRELFEQNWRRREADALKQQYLDAVNRAKASEERLNSMQNRFNQIDALRESIENRIRRQCSG